METQYSNEDLQKLIDGYFIKYLSINLHPHKCDLYKKILELIDVQIARAKGVTDISDLFSGHSYAIYPKAD